MDLSLRLGRKSDEYTAHANIQRELEHVVEVCKKTGKAAAAVALTPEMLADRIQEGYRLLLAGFDLDHLEADYRRMRDTFDTIMENMGPPS